MTTLVAIKTNGIVSIHFPDRTGLCATLCGLDGDDPHKSVQQETVALPRRAKVDCAECIGIFDHCRKFGESDIARGEATR